VSDWNSDGEGRTGVEEGEGGEGDEGHVDGFL